MSKEVSNTKDFSKIREALFPIHNVELKKFIPMGLILMCILFNYTMLRNMKDALIYKAPGAGPEAVPYLKGIFVLAAAVIFVVIYSKLSNMFSQEKLFYILVSSFLAFFGLFSFVLYPNHELLHPSLSFVQDLQGEFPRLKFLFSVWGVWTYSTFFVTAELWGSAMLSLLFWQFANEIVRTNEAKRFYPLFILLANTSLIASGEIVQRLTNVPDSPNVDRWGVALNSLSLWVIGVGILAMILYRWMHKNVLTDPFYYDAAEPKAPKKKKPKMGFVESFRFIFSNPYIGLIALLVLSYGMAINLIELIWNKQVALHFTDSNAVAGFKGAFSKWTGIATIVIIFLTKGVIRKFGWFAGAIITPVVLLVTGGIFFALVLFGNVFNPIVTSLGFSTIYAAVIVGATQNVLTKGSKYAFFDPTKEMSYIPLDQELKTKGKAVVDVIGGRLGKAAGGYTIMILFFITSAKDAMVIAPTLGFIIAAVVAFWILGVIALNKRYKQKLTEKEAE